MHTIKHNDYLNKNKLAQKWNCHGNVTLVEEKRNTMFLAVHFGFNDLKEVARFLNSLLLSVIYFIFIREFDEAFDDRET